MEKDQEAILKQLICSIEGHENQPLHMTCIDENCLSKGLICFECMNESHYGHRVLTLKKFLQQLRDKAYTGDDLGTEEVESLEYDIQQNLEIIHKNGNDLIEKMNNFRENLEKNMHTLAEQINKREEAINKSLLFESPKRLVVWLSETLREKEITSELIKTIEENINKLCRCFNSEEGLRVMNFPDVLSHSKTKIDEYGKFLKNLKTLFTKRLSQVESQFPILFSLNANSQEMNQVYRSVSVQTQESIKNELEEELTNKNFSKHTKASHGPGWDSSKNGNTNSEKNVSQKKAISINSSPKQQRLQLKTDKIVLQDKEFSYVKIQDPLYVGSEEVRCAFCHKSSRKVKLLKVLGKIFGPFFYNNNKDIYFVHELCALWTSGIYYDKQFSIFNTLFNEVKRATRLKCSLCKSFGAGVGCSIKNCNSTFHFKCLLSRKAKCQLDFNEFSILCDKHRPATSNKNDDSMIYYDSSSQEGSDIILDIDCNNSQAESMKEEEMLKENGDSRQDPAPPSKASQIRPESKYLKLRQIAEQESIDQKETQKETCLKPKKTSGECKNSIMDSIGTGLPFVYSAENKENTKVLSNKDTLISSAKANSDALRTEEISSTENISGPTKKEKK